jgi:signal transduction histidine kinase
MRADPGDAGGRQPLGRVVGQLLDRVWSVTEAEQALGVLLPMGRAMAALGMPPSQALVYEVTPGGGAPEVRYRDLSPQGGWRRVAAEEDIAPVVELWGDGGEARVIQAAEAAPAATAAALRLGGEVRSLLEIPFSHGVLGLYGREPGSFDPAVCAGAEQFALVLSVLYHRLDDLESLQATERKLRQAQRLQLVGQLTAEVATELRGPLTRVIGECELLQGNLLPEDALESAQAIQRAARQAQQIGRRLLQFVRESQPDKGWVSPNNLVVEAVELVRPTFAQEGIELTADLGRNLPWIEAHGEQVQQVVLNLLQNAREALRGFRAQGMVRVRTGSRGNSVLLEVEDNGPGIPGEIAGRIFEPFFTTKTESPGAGLGLSLCAGIVQDHGGELWVEPRVAGTCMALRLPVRQGDPAASG